VILTAAVVCAGCAVARVPIGAGPPFLRTSGFARLSDLRAVSPPAWAPDGTSVAFSTADAVWTIRIPGAPEDAHRLAPLAGVTRVAWSPDGQTLLALAGGRLFGIPLADPLPRLLVPMEGVRFLAWPPAGPAPAARAPRGMVQAVLAATTASAATIVWSVAIPTDVGDPAGPGRPRRLGSVPGDLTVRSLAWLPGDAGVVAAAEDRYGDSARLVFLTPGARASRVQPLPAGDHAALPSPEGRFIAYLEDAADGGSRVCAMRADGSGRRTLTAAGRYSGLAWSPSGTLLAFARQAGNRVALEIADVLTGEQLRVGAYRPEGTPSDALFTIAWGPDGTRLAFGPDTGPAAGFIWLATLERR